MSKRGYRSRYKGRQEQLSSVYGFMYADTDSIQVHPLTDTGKARQMVRELLSTPDPWDGVVEDDCIDYSSSYPSSRLMEEIEQWIADYEERKRHGTDRAHL